MESKVTRRKSTKAGERLTSKTDDLEYKRREYLKDKLKEKVEHERRALQLVELLSGPAVSEDFLINCAHLITADNYKDIVEERTIAKLCGYPICLNKLDSVPNQKYKISTKTNKIYDITERKCFCCNFCYKASKWFEVQILKTPLWLREDERPPDVKLMKKQDGGSSGLEVMLVDRPVKEADIENPVLPEAHQSAIYINSSDDGNQESLISKALSKCHLRVHWGELPQDSGDIQGAQAEKEKTLSCICHHPNESETAAMQDFSMQMLSFANCCQEIAGECPNADCEVEERFLSQSSVRTDHKQFATPFLDKTSSLIQITDETGPAVSQIRMTEAGVTELRGVSKPETTLVKLNLMERLKHTLLEWKTDGTMTFLYGSNYTMGDCYTWKHEEEEDLDEDDIQETSEGSLCSTRGTERPTTPAPDYITLCRATPAVDVEIKELTTECCLPKDSHKGTDNQDVTCEAKSSKDPILPLVDCHSQHVIQKRIVVERLNRSLKKIVGPLHLTMRDISSDLNNLVRTLRLTNTSIIHRGPEWTVIAVIFLHVLTEVSPLLRESLTCPSAKEFILFLMKEVQLTDQDLHSLIRLFNPQDELHQ
ncbi:putative RNA polymerase II subunit B1 CTD phosphatase rpap2 isoform X1 [Alosa alosa]|uniref:putative RNA polymerase II subunit B1 CTD phosphatase rpap2 isoform X1 n=1 Tax=Alosa alosa TaxID=278164 RepID=UPI0020151B50|nr:putative RNA polymerase II subunit B1 CTD phosphatase rpap2 isoform X1 [Alosa alosa]